MNQRFIIAVQNDHGGWNKIGFVTLKKRCRADDAIKQFFPPHTRSYENLLKSCRFLAADTAARSVDWKCRSLLIRTHKL